MSEEKILVWDMDGTLGDFYGVDGWLEDLENENPRPYIIAEPRYDMKELNNILEALRDDGWLIVVTSWLSKKGSQPFNDLVRIVKYDWLRRYGFPYDEIHFVKYGTTKANCTRRHGGRQILIDDNDKIRKGWKGESIDAKNDDVIGILLQLLFEEEMR